MKKLSFVAAILLLQIACPGNPNRLFAQNIRLGIRGGLSIPSLQGGNTEISQGYKSRIGHDFGVFGDLALTRHFAIELEAMFIRSISAWRADWESQCGLGEESFR